METLILLCLVIVIVLLLHDKIDVRKAAHKKEPEERPSVVPDILGKTKSISRLSPPVADKAGQKEKSEGAAATFESETGGKPAGIEIPQEEQDEVSRVMPDFEEEEEEWRIDGLSEGSQGFATGVTFEELSTFEMMLQKEKPEASEIEAAVDIVQRIQGTELLSLLESSMHGASEKIARLLDQSMARETASGSSTMRNGDLDQFDIGEFV